MRDDLPIRPRRLECAIVNLDNSRNEGTHWVAYVKVDKYCEYFNSYGNLKPPLELVKYLKPNVIFYNHKAYQYFNTTNCGHLCLEFLINFWKNINSKQLSNHQH